MPGAKLLLLDGNSLIHRAFHALPPLTNSQGLPTNAVYGFTTMLLKLLEEEQPDYLAIAFDKAAPTFRHQEFAAYKAHRPPTAPELGSQFPLVREVVQAMQIPILELAGYEADDVLGTLSKSGEAEGLKVVVVTGDRDLLQVVSSQTIIKIYRQGISNLETFDLEKIKEKYGLSPEQIPDMKGLMGDASDNIPGVPGIGEKTALKLLQEYPTVEEILEQAQHLKTKKVRESLLNYREQALLSKRLATICCAVPLDPYSWEELKKKGYSEEKLKEILERLEFKSLLKKLAPQNEEGEAVKEIQKLENNYRVIDSDQEVDSLKAQIEKEGSLALQLETDVEDPMRSQLQGVYLYWGGEESYYLPFSLMEKVKDILIDERIKKCGHDLKYQLIVLQRHGFIPKGFHFDTMVAAYLLNPSQSKYLIEDLANQFLTEPCHSLVQCVYQLKEALVGALDQLDLGELFREVEIPLVEVLAEMEMTGVSIDQEYLAQLSQQLGRELENLETNIYELAGEKFNINSPKQLGVVLFEKLNLPTGKKTKTGYSTNADVLESLKDKHPIVEHILHYRQLGKLKSTYVDALPKLVNPETGRVHTYLNQTVTATGRLSSSEPNLQNIPVKTQLGREIRQAFIPNEKENFLLAADYSQIELRILAHITQDQNLVESFQRNQDVHARTAAEVFGVELEAVSSEMRSKAKAVNFGIVYGISDFGLAQNLGVFPKEAKKYIESYFAKYPGVKKYMQETVEKAKEEGFVTTILHRRRYLPDLKSSNRNIRAFAERTAINTPIQGSAADIIKLAMLRVSRELKERKIKAKLLLQVHDELLLEVPEEELEQVAQLVREAMGGAVELSVPLDVDVQIGKNWCDLKK